jgi:TrmH RNA methyltransferase
VRGNCRAAAEGGRGVAACPRDDRPIALVLGNEEPGLPRATLKACAAIVRIPGSGLIQSINVAANATILLYAFAEPARSSSVCGAGLVRVTPLSYFLGRPARLAQSSIDERLGLSHRVNSGFIGWRLQP